jgi:membrane protease YdiL (CAAX protease family)
MFSLKKAAPASQLLIFLGLFGFAIVLLGVILNIDLRPSVNFTFKDNNNPNVQRLAFVINTVVGFLLPAFAFAKMFDQPPMEKIGFRSTRLENILLAVALIGVSLPMINTISIWNKGLHLPASMKATEDALQNMSRLYEEQISKVIAMPHAGMLFINIIVMALLPGIAEELFFRGCMQQIFQRWFRNTWAAVIVTAVVFSVFHFDFYGFFPRIILGIVLGLVFAKTGSLYPGIMAHLFNNSMALVFTFAGQHSNLKKNYATEDLNIPAWTAIVSLVLVIYLVTRLKRDHHFDYLDNDSTSEHI